jgi:hypothetical protein
MKTTGIHISMELCPFCESEGMIIENDYYDGCPWYHAECSKCDCVLTDSRDTMQQAINAWNKRG